MNRLAWLLRVSLRDEVDGLQRMSRDVRVADLATLTNALLGLAAVLLAAAGHIEAAAGLVMLGVIVDGVDGALARAGWGGGPLGPTLDTLADTVTFGVAPATILVLAAPHDPVRAAVAGAYLVAVLLRLARFESLRETRPLRHFSGLSSPGGALVLLALLLVGVMKALLLGGVVVVAFLMSSRVRYPKLRGALGVAAVLVLLLVLSTHWFDALRREAMWLLLAFMLAYLVAGPYYVLRRQGPIRGVA